MSHIFLDRRGGRLALYLGGELQFDRDDERLYHEPLALVPAALAARRFPGRSLRALVLGGGDGLALRELLRHPRVAEAHLVERDPEMLRLGRGELAQLNAGSLSDPRARVHLADARDFLPTARGFHVVVYDLTYPGDVAGAELFQVKRLVQARKALLPGGILSLNSVSPEKTPEAFACIGSSLAAAGLRPTPYSFELPSFAKEGYGRWGFFFASRRPIAEDELSGLELPAGASLTADLLRSGTLLPEAFGGLSCAPNRSDELLYYLYNGKPLPWQGPLLSAAFRAGRSAGPRLTVAQGFASWLKAPRGRKTLEGLLACLPLSRREHTRQAILEWSHHAEALFREVDLKAFVDAALERAASLPKAWVRELRRLKERIEQGLPDMRSVLELSWRVFAVLLIALLLANLCFPDNLYAKGYSSHYGGGGGGGGGGGEDIHFSMSSRASPFSYHHEGWRFARGGYRSQVYDSKGTAYQSHGLVFSDQEGKRKPVHGLLALAPGMQVLESGEVSYATSLPEYSSLLEPGRLRVLDKSGKEVLVVLTPSSLRGQASGLILADNPALDKAIEDHKKWTEWTTFGILPGKVEDSEMDELLAIRQALAAAKQAWKDAPPPPGAPPEAAWLELFPGVHLQPAPAQSPKAARSMALISPDGKAKVRSLQPPSALAPEDPLLFALLKRQLSKDESLRPVLAAWLARHGAALGPEAAKLPPPPAPPPAPAKPAPPKK